MAGFALAAFLMVAAAPDGSSGDDTPAPIAALDRCRAIAAATDRLACYDQAAEAISAARARKDLVTVSRAEVHKTRRGFFGFTLPKLAFFKGDDSVDDVPDQLETTIRQVEPVGMGNIRFVTQEQMVWETTDASALTRRPKVGDKVTLTRGLLGRYFLKIGIMKVSARRIS